MRKLLPAFIVVMLVIAGCSVLNNASSPQDEDASPELNALSKLKFHELETNLSKTEIDLSQVLSGGPGKDGIPAINDPKFISVAEAEAELDEEVLGIFLDINGDQRYYPYTILVWHEIVNDTVGNQPVAVTFCPLCGSAITFDRNVNGKVVEFGVSGLLYESNLLMYDSENESLWSQALGRAVVGDDAGTNLDHVPMQLLTFAEFKQKFPEAQVLSNDTGHSRNYGFFPYGDYDESDDLVFPTSVQDKRFHPKTIMYVVNVGSDKSAAFVWEKAGETGTAELEVDGQQVTLTRNGGEAVVTIDGQEVPGYFEMWFSWATHHQDNGYVWGE